MKRIAESNTGTNKTKNVSSADGLSEGQSSLLQRKTIQKTEKRELYKKICWYWNFSTTYINQIVYLNILNIKSWSLARY